MKPSGKTYPANISLINFPSYTAHLLKGKKHEWVILACAQGDVVRYFWANKGNDGNQVAFNVDLQEMCSFCKSEGCETIMRFHNHPNSDPQHYTCLLASQQDRISAKSCSERCNKVGINWIDFVCERGNFVEFYRSFSNQYFPSEASYERICRENNESQNYYKLQRELGIFR